MESALSTFLEPANQLRDLLFTPRLVYFCAFFAYEGFKNGSTLTHGGMRKGAIAKVYAVFYVLGGLGNLWRFPSELKKFLAIDPSTIKEALLFADPFPQLGFIFIGLAIFMLLIAEWLMRARLKQLSRRSRNSYRIHSARKFIYWMVALPFVLGIHALLGLPEWVNVSIFVFFAYFAPFTSPQELKRTMKVPDDNSSKPKTISSAQNVD